MKSKIFFLLTVISNVAVADNILCVPEAGAGVEHTKDGKIKAGLADISKRKYLLSNESGNWQLKILGQDNYLFNNCISKYFCEDSEDYTGTFFLNTENVFTIIWLDGNNQRETTFLAKGRCSKL